MRKALLLLTLSWRLFGQDAKLMILEKQDTKQLRSAWQDYQAAKTRWESTKTEIALKYTVVDGKTLDGWDQVKFSVDFRAVVPDPTPTIGSSWWKGCSSANSTIYVDGSGIFHCSPISIMTTNGTGSYVLATSDTGQNLTGVVAGGTGNSATFSGSEGAWSVPPTELKVDVGATTLVYK